MTNRTRVSVNLAIVALLFSSVFTLAASTATAAGGADCTAAGGTCIGTASECTAMGRVTISSDCTGSTTSVCCTPKPSCSTAGGTCIGTASECTAMGRVTMVADCTGGTPICCVAKPASASAGSAAPAAGTSPNVRKLTPQGIGDVTLQVLAGRFINLLIGISGSIALLMFVWGGFLMLTSAGDDSKVDHGKKAMFWAAMGLIVIFGAYTILSAVFGVLQS